MQSLKPLSLFGLLAAFSLHAGAQTVNRNQVVRSQSVARSAPATVATVDAYGNVVRATVRNYNAASIASTPSVGGMIAHQGIYGPQNSARIAPGYPYGVSSNIYYPPSYPYPTVNVDVTNNYYFPEQDQVYRGPLLPSIIAQSQPPWTPRTPVVPSYGGYIPAPAYPAYGVPVYGYPTIPYGAYGYPAPAYGTTTTYIGGTGYGTVITQSQSNGFGVSVGRGGLSVQLGNRNTTTTTTVTPF
jgi:hypothetical protein